LEIDFQSRACPKFFHAVVKIRQSLSALAPVKPRQNRRARARLTTPWSIVSKYGDTPRAHDRRLSLTNSSTVDETAGWQKNDTIADRLLLEQTSFCKTCHQSDWALPDEPFDCFVLIAPHGESLRTSKSLTRRGALFWNKRRPFITFLNCISRHAKGRSARKAVLRF
jgi:hypothetical protein